MAKKYNIGSKLPILIAEKTGPHFAVGDTCYSFAEDSPMYNPDGKEVIARDNEISLLRKEDISRAYFSCHTDITLSLIHIFWGEGGLAAREGQRSKDSGCEKRPEFSGMSCIHNGISLDMVLYCYCIACFALG